MCVCVCVYVYIYTHIYVFACMYVYQFMCLCVCGHLLNLGSLRTRLGYVVRKFIFSDLDSGSALNCSSNSPMMNRTHTTV